MQTIYDMLSEDEKIMYQLKGSDLYMQELQQQLLQRMNQFADKAEELNKEIK